MQNCNLKVLFLFILLISTSASSQSLPLEKLSSCLLAKCDDRKFYIENQFKEVYSGPRKMGGFIALFQNIANQEYIFPYADQNGETEQIIYYIPTKKIYNTITRQFVKGIKMKGNGRVWYDDGKKYYQISIRPE